MNWDAAQEWLASTHLFRCLAGTMFRSYARRRAAALDHQVPARSQAHTLIRLVHRAHATRFGREHDFRRIRNADDYRRLVPLRGPAALWRNYWQAAYPNLADLTWPGPLPWLASVDPVPGGPRFVPVSAELYRSHRIAALTALSLFQVVRPRARPLLGRTLLLGNAPLLGSMAPAGTEGETLFRTLPPLLRPFVLGPTGEPADLAMRRDVTCVVGEPAQLQSFFERLLTASNRDRGVDLWPQLTAVLSTRTLGPMRARLAALVGNPEVAILEFCFRPEATLAVEDPRYGQLRFLSDHGVYCEFVPRDELGRPQPTRHGLDQVEPGVPYAVAVTSPAGMWACPVGFTVCFSRRGQSLLEWARYTPADALGLDLRLPVLADPPSLLPVQPPHSRPAAHRVASG